MLPEHISQWFTKRGITKDTLARFNIGWNGREIVIPILHIKKYRRDPATEEGPKYRYEYGATAQLFNYDENAEEVILVEGELDAILLSQYGYNAVSSTGGVGTFKDEWIELLKNKVVYILYDNDEAGVRGALKLHQRIPNSLIIPFPRFFTGKDVTDYFQKYSPQSFAELKKHAYHLCLPVETIDDVKSELEYCKTLRRTLNERDHSSRILEMYVYLLNGKKSTFAIKIRREDSRKDPHIGEVKYIPIPQFVKFNPSGKANCIWHSDKNPSMQYYPKTNSVYCFTCGGHGDVIDVIKQLYNYSFSQALYFLKDTLHDTARN